jgi:hypothetical protein
MPSDELTFEVRFLTPKLVVKVMTSLIPTGSLTVVREPELYMSVNFSWGAPLSVCVC